MLHAVLRAWGVSRAGLLPLCLVKVVKVVKVVIVVVVVEAVVAVAVAVAVVVVVVVVVVVLFLCAVFVKVLREIVGICGDCYLSM